MNDTSVTRIYDYNNQEIFLLPDLDSGNPCSARMIDPSDPFINRTFGFRYVNGSVHIGSVQSFFDIYTNESMNYTGVTDVRGISSDTWETCFSIPNNSYVLRYYFATADWRYAYDVNNLPVQIELMGRRVTDEGEVEDLNHVYSFVNFNDGVSDDEFNVPIGLPCTDRIAGKPITVPNFPDHFSLYVEDNDIERKRSDLLRVSWLVLFFFVWSPLAVGVLVNVLS